MHCPVQKVECWYDCPSRQRYGEIPRSQTLEPDRDFYQTCPITSLVSPGPCPNTSLVSPGPCPNTSLVSPGPCPNTSLVFPGPTLNLSLSPKSTYILLFAYLQASCRSSHCPNTSLVSPGPTPNLSLSRYLQAIKKRVVSGNQLTSHLHQMTLQPTCPKEVKQRHTV